MPKAIADITMSLDGYVTGPGADEQHGAADPPRADAARGGTPLFRPGTRQMYRRLDVRTSKNAVHLAYERV